MMTMDSTIAWAAIRRSKGSLCSHSSLLARHGVAVERLHSSNPGRIIYEDDVQVIVVPFDA